VLEHGCHVGIRLGRGCRQMARALLSGGDKLRQSPVRASYERRRHPVHDSGGVQRVREPDGVPTNVDEARRARRLQVHGASDRGLEKIDRRLACRCRIQQRRLRCGRQLSEPLVYKRVNITGQRNPRPRRQVFVPQRSSQLKHEERVTNAELVHPHQQGTRQRKRQTRANEPM
jgi:hypothetical protein